MYNRFHLQYDGSIYDCETCQRYTTLTEIWPIINDINDRLTDYDERSDLLEKGLSEPSHAVQLG